MQNSEISPRATISEPITGENTKTLAFLPTNARANLLDEN